jgi:hypothetical protein
MSRRSILLLLMIIKSIAPGSPPRLKAAAGLNDARPEDLGLRVRINAWYGC